LNLLRQHRRYRQRLMNHLRLLLMHRRRRQRQRPVLQQHLIHLQNLVQTFHFLPLRLSLMRQRHHQNRHLNQLEQGQNYYQHHRHQCLLQKLQKQNLSQMLLALTMR
jgi:hypothetical protein